MLRKPFTDQPDGRDVPGQRESGTRKAHCREEHAKPLAGAGQPKTQGDAEKPETESQARADPLQQDGWQEAGQSHGQPQNRETQTSGRVRPTEVIRHDEQNDPKRSKCTRIQDKKAGNDNRKDYPFSIHARFPSKRCETSIRYGLMPDVHHDHTIAHVGGALLTACELIF